MNNNIHYYLIFELYYAYLYLNSVKYGKNST